MPQFLILLILLILSKNAPAKTFDVDISTGRPAASNEAYYHGETIEFRAVRGRSVVTNVEYGCIYYQTNGMEQAWWHTDSLVFHPTNDVGAASYRFFLEGRDDLGRDWHANGLLRLLPSPGFTPNVLELPIQHLDFAAIDYVNDPWLKPAATNELSASLSSLVSRSSLASTNYTDTATNSLASTLRGEIAAAEPGNYATVSNKAMTALQSYTESDPTISSWAKASSKPSYTASEVGALPDDTTHLSGDVPTSRTINGKALSSNITLSASDVGAATASSVSTLSSQVTSIGAHLNAEDARFVSTNYNSAVHMPEASAEVNISNEWLVIWREMTRWNAFTGPGFDWSAWCGFNCFLTNLLAELDQKADRAWGFYDSHTGLYAPEGYTQISSSNVLIAAGMGYQRTITAEGTYWVLTANEPYATYGISSNGFFRVHDADGNVQFEIVKGDKRTVPAPAGGVTVGSGSSQTLTISYPVESQPTLEVALSLSYPSSWHAEADASCPAVVTWTGSSGAYVATVTPAAPATQLFVRATYQVGGSTYINNRAPTSLSGGIIYNGTLYMPTPNGNKLEFVAQ